MTQSSTALLISFPALMAALQSGRLKISSEPHINTGKTCTVISRTDRPRIVWLPAEDNVEIVLQDGLEGEGEWLIATSTDQVWQIVRDYWNESSDESAEEIVLETPERLEAVAYILKQLLKD